MTDLYLLWFDPEADEPESLDFHGDAHVLADGFWMVRSDLTRSKLYHRIKWQLPDDAALLLAPLDDSRDGWPKFKGLAEGALKWLREG
ncbi:hypothetical protein [Alteraurantiacibacter aquimixticola]|uniref:Uncharacterized protein n=1 Tax=Alteraurantiacibacter aquimixticola TaxID=2489173 RepID=A0A4T3F083_9SPHN|nr:hypothetical protein [Alteraurantiacibacter aquimixticola]TIX50461.1 hypothetical protein E5222_09310 [Alteraurantiacibacter aquimixticola]